MLVLGQSTACHALLNSGRWGAKFFIYPLKRDCNKKSTVLDDFLNNTKTVTFFIRG